MPSVKAYPFDRPKARRINMNIQSEEMNGWDMLGGIERWRGGMLERTGYEGVTRGLNDGQTK